VTGIVWISINDVFKSDITLDRRMSFPRNLGRRQIEERFNFGSTMIDGFFSVQREIARKRGCRI